jgi:hypothetical protein
LSGDCFVSRPAAWSIASSEKISWFSRVEPTKKKTKKTLIPTMAGFRSLFAALALLSAKALAQTQCVSYGIDYANGGAYYIDGSSSQYFTFITVFQGKRRILPAAAPPGQRGDVLLTVSP